MVFETRLIQTKTWKKFHRIFVSKIAERSFWLPLFVDITIDFDWIWWKIWFCVGRIDLEQAISFQWYDLNTKIRHFNHSIQKLCWAGFKTIASRIRFFIFFFSTEIYPIISLSYSISHEKRSSLFYANAIKNKKKRLQNRQQ